MMHEERIDQVQQAMLQADEDHQAELQHNCLAQKRSAWSFTQEELDYMRRILSLNGYKVFTPTRRKR